MPTALRALATVTLMISYHGLGKLANRSSQESLFEAQDWS